MRLVMPGTLAVVLLILPFAGAHDVDEEEVVEPLEEDLMFARSTVDRTKPVIVVPPASEEPACTGNGTMSRAVRVGPDATARFRANETHVEAVFHVDSDAFVAFAVETGNVRRSLIEMMQYAVVMHHHGATVTSGLEPGHNRTGMLGVPYFLPQELPPGHEAFDHELPGDGIRLSHAPDDLASFCKGEETGRFSIVLPRAAFPDKLQEGAVSHAVILHDPEILRFLPRPLDETTHVTQVNLYLMRAGEDLDAVRRALEPEPGPWEVVPLAALAVGLVWVSRR